MRNVLQNQHFTHLGPKGRLQAWAHARHTRGHARIWTPWSCVGEERLTIEEEKFFQEDQPWTTEVGLWTKWFRSLQNIKETIQ